MQNVITFNHPTFQEFADGIQQVLDLMKGGVVPEQKVKVTFSEPVFIQVNKRNKKELSEMKVKFFMSTCKRLAYTFHQRSGYPASWLPIHKVVSVSVDEEVKKKSDLEKVLSVLRRVHPNAWHVLHQRPESLVN